MLSACIYDIYSRYAAPSLPFMLKSNTGHGGIHIYHIAKHNIVMLAAVLCIPLSVDIKITHYNLGIISYCLL